jgi:hypothetical protein
MRKFVMLALAGSAFALAAPVTASAAPVLGGGVMQQIIDSVDNTSAVAWHCRRWSGWCRGRRMHSRYWSRRR